MSSLLDSIFSARIIKGGVEFVQRKPIEFVGDSVSVVDDPVNERTVITIGAGSTSAHSSSHVSGGADAIDGDRLTVGYLPSGYTRQIVVDETDTLAELTSNLRGIDNELSTLAISIATVRKVTYRSENGTSHTFVIGDAYTTILCGTNTGLALALPSNATVPYEVGTVIGFIPMGTGQITFSAGSGAVVVSSGSELKSARRYGPMFAQKTGTDDWLISGEKAA